jgi:hypothetical protein
LRTGRGTKGKLNARAKTAGQTARGNCHEKAQNEKKGVVSLLCLLCFFVAIGIIRLDGIESAAIAAHSIGARAVYSADEAAYSAATHTG